MAAAWAFGTWVLLILWAIMCLTLSPSREKIERSCAGHGKVVSYTASGMLNYAPGNGTVVCSDGRVLEVK